MVEKIKKEEITFTKMEDFFDYYNKRKVQNYSTPSQQLKLVDENNLSINGQKFPLTVTGMNSLLKETGIPESYAYNICDSKLLKFSVNNILSRSNKLLTMKLINGKFDLISKNINNMIDDKLIVEALSDTIDNIHLVEKSDGFLRVTFLKDFEVEIARGDIIQGGYEILNYENKANGLSFSIFLNRSICQNGQVSSEPIENFSFSSKDNVGLSEIINRLREKISKYQNVLEYISAFKFILNKKVENHLPILEDYLKKFSGKDYYQDNFSDFSEETTWFEVINDITASAKINKMERKRDFEIMAGSLLETFFHGDKYSKHLFRKKLCGTCPILN